MNAEIIAIGDEILIGQTIDTNSGWIATQLNQIGIKLREIHAISDDADHIINTLEQAENNANIVLITGGLGPTKDDITKETLCKYFDTKLVVSQEVLEDVKNFILKRFGKTNLLNSKQAEVPESCTVIRNAVGTAPCMWFERSDTIFVSMPGVPHEMKHLMTHEILPRLKEKFDTTTIYHRTVLTSGRGESFLADTLEQWEDNLPKDMKLAYLPSLGTVKLRLSAYHSSEDIVERVDTEIRKLYQLIPELIFGEGESSLQKEVGNLLTTSKQTLATAESCTGGNISQSITSVAGCSAYFMGGVTAYANQTKENILGVPTQLIEQHGAVSEEVARKMAEGVRQALKSDYGVATTGIAGPEGGTADKPVGTVWISVSSPKQTIARVFHFANNRERNIQLSTNAALKMLFDELKSNSTVK